MENITEVKDLEHLKLILRENPAVLLYFSHDACNVCKVLKPKIADMLSEDFPAMKMLYVNTEKLPEVAGQLRVFTVPTVSVYFEGQESMRYSRNLSIGELARSIERPYSLLFG